MKGSGEKSWPTYSSGAHRQSCKLAHPLNSKANSWSWFMMATTNSTSSISIRLSSLKLSKVEKFRQRSWRTPLRLRTCLNFDRWLDVCSGFRDRRDRTLHQQSLSAVVALSRRIRTCMICIKQFHTCRRQKTMVSIWYQHVSTKRHWSCVILTVLGLTPRIIQVSMGH